MESSGPTAFGGDGASIEDGCLVFEYAKEVLNETDSPTIIKPCIVDGEQTMYVSAYTGTGEFIDLVHNGNERERAACLVLLLQRGEEEAITGEVRGA